jgi:acyl-CoA synthetase (AMP-forming)/AMP-acid ligase II
MSPVLDRHPALRGATWIATDGPGSEDRILTLPSRYDPDAVALLQYTSGSTGMPRGVAVTHSNLIHNSRQIYRLFGHSTDTIGVSWLPPYHDMGLVGGVLQPMFGGFPVIQLSPLSFVQRPIRWLEAISREGATSSGAPNFAYELCIRKTTPDQRKNLDLSTWKVAFNGSEPIRPETLQRFSELFAPCGFDPAAFLPCYGLAEATLLVSVADHSPARMDASFAAAELERRRAVPARTAGPGVRRLVRVGRSIDEQSVEIVDPERLEPCGPGIVGEIWVQGPSVAQGYWNRPAETARAFNAYLSNGGPGPFLRTGDLGFKSDGQLYIVGRTKNLLIFRGRNYYAEDIETTVESSHSAIRPGSVAAFSADVDGEERLIVMAEVERHPQDCRSTVETAIRCSVSESYGLAVHWLSLELPGGVPKTTSGKVQRQLCRAEFLGRVNVPVPALTPDVQQLESIRT